MAYRIIRQWLEFLAGVVHRLWKEIITCMANWTDEENTITTVANKYGKILLVAV